VYRRIHAISKDTVDHAVLFFSQLQIRVFLVSIVTYALIFYRATPC